MTTKPSDPRLFRSGVEALIAAEDKAKRAHEQRERARRDLENSETEAASAKARVLEAAGPSALAVVVSVTASPSGKRYLVEIPASKGANVEREIYVREIEEIILR